MHSVQKSKDDQTKIFPNGENLYFIILLYTITTKFMTLIKRYYHKAKEPEKKVSTTAITTATTIKITTITTTTTTTKTDQ